MKAKQEEFRFRSWGGARKGAGRPRGEHPFVPRVRRKPLSSRFPVHVTVRLKEGLPSLRTPEADKVLRAAFAKACERFGFRLVHYSVQGNHIHMIVEAKDRRALSRGMQGLLVRIARGLNKLWQRKGSVFADRYHDRILKTPREVRHALAYVLHNARRHGIKLRQAFDRFSSGAWFDGWKEKVVVRGLEGVVRPVAAAVTWLLREGWRRHRLIGVGEMPGG